MFNSAYSAFQFWDGRAATLEDQSQGPVQNDVEMFDGSGTAWEKAIHRMKADEEYVKQFKRVFGTGPTRDGAAKAIAAYERTVLSGNSIQDRAELAMRKRVDTEESGKYELKASDYADVLKAAFSSKDVNALKALKLDPEKDSDKIPSVAKALLNGRTLFFNKARCNACHVGDNFTDNTFHNLGVGVKDGKLPAGSLGRFGSAPTGHKNPEFAGAFKTPTLRHLLGTSPYMHDGSEKTLLEVIDFYDKGGNANEYLDVKMRDEDAERLLVSSEGRGQGVQGAGGEGVQRQGDRTAQAEPDQGRKGRPRSFPRRLAGRPGRPDRFRPEENRQLTGDPMALWYRIFGARDTLPAPAEVEQCLAGVGVSAPIIWAGDEQAWYRAEIAAGEGTPLVLERWLSDEEGIRAELNTWAAFLETCDYSPHHTELMERAIQTRQLFTLRRPIDHANEALVERVSVALSRHLAAITGGFYQADAEGFFAADGTLLVQEY